jgi:hypothetical protein
MDKTTEHQPPQIFDRTFKFLMHSSSRAIVHFINGLFGKDYPPDSTVGYHSTETVRKDLTSIHNDIVIVINDSDRYVVEAQIGDDSSIAHRILDYSLAAAAKTDAPEGCATTVFLPSAVVIYWEASDKTPDSIPLKFVAPDGGELAYRVPTFKFLDHTIAELEARNMSILLPFYVLKPRRRLGRAKSDDERLRLAEEMKQIIAELVNALQRSVDRETMASGDMDSALDRLNQLYLDLYRDRKELKGANAMAEEVYVSRIQLAVEAARIQKQREIARKLIQEAWSTEKIAKTVEMDAAEVEVLRREMLPPAM